MVRNLAACLGAALMTACFLQSGFATEPIAVFVSIAPQKSFVQQIGKDRVDVQVMVPPGASPATYEPRPRQMAAISNTAIYFAIGVPFENAWLEKIAAANQQMKVVHTDQGIEKRFMAAHHHTHKPAEPHESRTLTEGDHRHENSGHPGRTAPARHRGRQAGLDPHIWLSPPLVKIQARAVLDALQQIDPDHRNFYEANFKTFSTRIDQLDADLRGLFTNRQGMQFMVFHPAWGYFADTYGLRQVPVEIEGKNPKPGQLKALIEHARQNEIRMIFVQPQFATKSAEIVAREIGGQVAPADPLAGDWEDNLRRVAEKFKAALK